MREMWRYIHARTSGRLFNRIKGPVPDHTDAFKRFLLRLIESRNSFSILQIGAYDGISNDSVHDLLTSYPHVRAVLLEPQPDPFSLLQKRWEASDRVITVRAALSHTTGERPLYVIADAYKHLHPFPEQVSSFYRSRVEAACSRYVWRPSADFVTAVSVPTIDWQTLIERYGRFDFLAIDTEGYDAEIIRRIDFSSSAPDVILYEHRHLSRSERRRCEKLLARHGYTVRRVNNLDAVATRSDALVF